MPNLLLSSITSQSILPLHHPNRKQQTSPTICLFLLIRPTSIPRKTGSRTSSNGRNSNRCSPKTTTPHIIKEEIAYSQQEKEIPLTGANGIHRYVTQRVVL